MPKKTKKLRAGVIGLGMGRNHIQGYQQHPAAEVVALADIDAEKLAQTGKEFGVKSLYKNPLEMLEKENLDVVSVAVPNKHHMELSIAALQSGAHVLCEKPMAMNTAEAEAMLEASKKANKRLMLNYSFRFSKSAWILKQQVNNGVMGDIYFGRTVWHRRRGIPGLSGQSFGESTRTGPWFYNKELAGGGPLIDLGVHRLDLALWYMDFPEPLWVVGSTYDKLATRLAKEKNVEYSVEDLAVGTIKFKNGATLQLEASWAANIPEKDLMETRLLGTKAGLLQQNVNQGYTFEGQLILEKDGDQFDMLVNDSSEEPLKAYPHFIDCIVNDTPHIGTPEEGLITMRILDALYQSAKENKPVMLG